MFKKSKLTLVIGLLLIFMMSVLAGCAQEEAPDQSADQPPAAKELKLATTTSTEDSGLLDYILPEFEKDANYKVQVIAVGTGQAIE
ncbi:MAG: tungsten ABC transporter substrate-binding protein, partial [Syntrophomonadaceae bacterium]|nr:tungsten ABC transporter substrate-binding protein [Syntrophomonadaceae bacterium]